MLLLVDCVGHYGNEMLRLCSIMCALSVNHQKKHEKKHEFPLPSELLWNCANLPCLVNLALNLNSKGKQGYFSEFFFLF